MGWRGPSGPAPCPPAELCPGHPRTQRGQLWPRLGWQVPGSRALRGRDSVRPGSGAAWFPHICSPRAPRDKCVPGDGCDRSPRAQGKAKGSWATFDAAVTSAETLTTTCPKPHPKAPRTAPTDGPHATTHTGLASAPRSPRCRGHTGQWPQAATGANAAPPPRRLTARPRWSPALAETGWGSRPTPPWAPARSPPSSRAPAPRTWPWGAPLSRGSTDGTGRGSGAHAASSLRAQRPGGSRASGRPSVGGPWTDRRGASG